MRPNNTYYAQAGSADPAYDTEGPGEVMEEDRAFVEGGIWEKTDVILELIADLNYDVGALGVALKPVLKLEDPSEDSENKNMDMLNESELNLQLDRSVKKLQHLIVQVNQIKRRIDI